MTPEQFSVRVKEGQAKSAKHQARLVLQAKGPWAREAKMLRSIFAKGKPLSAWEKMCGASNG